VAETFLILERETHLDAVLSYPGLVLLRIDGEEILRRDDRARTQPTEVLAAGVVLSAGAHRITLRVAVERGYKRNVGLTLLPRGGGDLVFQAGTLPDGYPMELPTPPAYSGSGVVLDRGEPTPWVSVENGMKTSSPPVLAGLVDMAIASNDEWLLAAARRKLKKLAPNWAAKERLVYDHAQASWIAPSAIRKTAALRALREASKRVPDQNMLRLLLAKGLRGQRAKEAAQRAVDELLMRGPEEAANWIEAARYYEWRGFSVKAEDAWRRAADLHPDNCSAQRQLYLALRTRGVTPASLGAPQKRCELTSWFYASDVLRARGEPAAYLEVLRRDVARSPDDPNTWAAWVRGVKPYDAARARQVAEAALGWHPANETLVALAADLFDSTGQEDRAREILAAGLAEHSGSQILHRRLAELNGKLPLQDLLADGPRAIRDFEREVSPPQLNASAVFALDYMARRYFDDGTSADVTHLIVKILSKEGLNEHGEIGFPKGAVPLLLRTIKRGGRVIEPKPQPGKAKVSMTGLDVGDYVEYAYLTFSGRIPTQRGAAQGPFFYFMMSDIASAHSELIVETPSSWEPVFVRRNVPPEAEVSERDGVRRYRFLRRGSVQPRAEPNSVGKEEFLPNLILIHRYGWEEVHRRFQDQLAGVGYLTPALEAASSRAVAEANAKTDRQKVEALFAFVIGAVETSNQRDFRSPASFVLASREGNPVVLLRALLSAQGIESSVWLVRPSAADPVDTEVPGFRKYKSTVLRVQLDDADLWLAPWSPASPFEGLSPGLQGASAINIEPGVPFSRATTPTSEDDISFADTLLDATIDEAGRLEGRLTVTGRNSYGAALRGLLRRLGTPDRTRKYLERRLNYVISGAELVDWRVKAQEEREEPLVIEMDFRRPNYARVMEDGSILIEDRYDLPDLTRRFARLPERRVPMLLPFNSQFVRVRLRVPKGRKVQLDGLGDLDVQSAFGSYTRTVRPLEDGVELVTRLTIPTRRIAVDAYPDFVRWAGDVDRGTYLRIEVK
jgi:tetratricopeptide (TPR) repeat protein